MAPARSRRTRLAVINRASVAHVDHQHDEFEVFNLADDSVSAYPETPQAEAASRNFEDFQQSPLDDPNSRQYPTEWIDRGL